MAMTGRFCAVSTYNNMHNSTWNCDHNVPRYVVLIMCMTTDGDDDPRNTSRPHDESLFWNNKVRPLRASR